MVVTDPSHGEAGEASTSVFLGEKKNQQISVIEIFTGRICVCVCVSYLRSNLCSY